MPPSSSPAPEPDLLHETRHALLQAARRSFGSIPEDRVVEHALAFTGEADFAVRMAALDALERRWQFAKRDGLRVAARPEGGRVLGSYATSRGG